MLTELPEWKKLDAQYSKTKNQQLGELFSADTQRAQKYSREFEGLFVDFSKQLITDETFECLLDLAKSRQVNHSMADMQSGHKINKTENREVLHTALRNTDNDEIQIDNENITDTVNAELDKMREFADGVRNENIRGFTGKPIKKIVNIGIGGSYLGPLMAVEALKHYSDKSIEVRFISNVDGNNFADVTEDLNMEETLFIVASKTFTTQETMTNATTARKLIVEKLGEDAVGKHFLALSTNAEGVKEFGIAEDRTFGFWDWVGGRYSLMSAIGLPLMIANGPSQFDEMREGANSIDKHVFNSDFKDNIPLILALVSIWNQNFLGAQTEVVVPYSQPLYYLPSYLQQASMESNGKSTTTSGSTVTYQTSSVLWGGTGTDSQHSFFQLLHQGTILASVDLIGVKTPPNNISDHNLKLLANLIAQGEALAFGRNEEDTKKVEDDESIVPHKVFAGNKPSTTIVVNELVPYSLGQLIAMYEHKIFYQGVIWEINSFDQMGVELGKSLATQILDEQNGSSDSNHDSSTTQLINRLLK